MQIKSLTHSSRENSTWKVSIWTLSAVSSTIQGYKIAYIENMGATLDFFDMIDLSDNEIIKLGNFAYLQK